MTVVDIRSTVLFSYECLSHCLTLVGRSEKMILFESFLQLILSLTWIARLFIGFQLSRVRIITGFNLTNPPDAT